jgi:ankyrin repeat protein
MLAARNGHVYALAELLRNDAEINKREKDFHEPGNFKKIISKGRTALHFAASTGISLIRIHIF